MSSVVDKVNEGRAKISVKSLGAATTVEELTDFLGFSNPVLKQGLSVELIFDEGGEHQGAYIYLPRSSVDEVMGKNGTEFKGKKLELEVSTSNDATTDTAAATTSSVVQPSNTGQNFIPFVLLDFSFARDVYQYRSLTKAEVVWAVNHTFGEDPTRRLVSPRRRDLTTWTIETDNIDLYQGKDTVKDDGENSVASIKIKNLVTNRTNRNLNEPGKRYSSNRSVGDLLLTLDKADTLKFRNISDEELTRRIVSLGIGRIKRGVQPQPTPGTREPNGNKYVVLEGVKDADKEKIPQCFEFPDGGGGSNRMWINYYGKPRRCRFCSEFHDPSTKICPKEQFARQLEQERAACARAIKTYSDSTLRLARQGSLTGDVDAMSGGTTGNILNAVDVDTKCTASNVILVAGQNDLQRRMTNEEFVWSVRKKEERLRDLSTKKRVAVLAPPNHDFFDPESLAREELLHSSLKGLSDEGAISLWENPIDGFDADHGSHPTEDQTKSLIKFLHQKCLEIFNTPYLLPSAVDRDDAITAPRYSGVSSLYRFGCGSCNSRERNKWANVCSDCSEKLSAEEWVGEGVQRLSERADEIYEAENPAIDDDVLMTDADLTCEECAVTFTGGKEIREHFNTHHPSVVTPGNKRKRRALSPADVHTNVEDDDDSTM